MTMKRLFALLLVLAMLLTAVPGLAATKPLWEKFQTQVKDAAFRGTVTFEASGDGTSAIEPSVWLIIRSLASRITLAADQSVTKRTGVGEATLRLNLDDQALARVDLRYNKQLMGLSSTLLAGEDVFYTFDRNWDVSQAFLAAIQGEGGWPPVWKMLLEMERQPESWKTRLKEKLLPYETKLGVWLNGFAAFSTGEIEGVKYTELSCSIPFRAVKTEIQQLMVDFYSDQDMLSVLREAVTAQEAQAYFQPGMQNTFIALLEALNLEGDVEIVRRYSSQGKLMLDMMTLPFTEESPVSSLTITLRPDEYGDVWGLAGQTWNGMDFDVTCLIGEESIYTGSVDLILPPEDTGDSSYIVNDGALIQTQPENRAVAFDYSFSWDPGEETYTLSTDQYTRNLSATLLIRPRDMEDMPTQSLALNLSLDSTSNTQAITHLNGALTWHDLDSGASITATLTSRTASPFAVSTLDNVVAMRVDQLTAESLSAVAQRWRENLQTQLDNLINQLVTSVFSFGMPL